MDYVHQKRVATLKRRKEEEFAATAARLNQRAEPLAGEPSSSHARKPSLSSEQLARLLSDDDEDWGASEPSANSSLSPSVQGRDSQEPAPTQLIFERPQETIEMTPSGRPYRMWAGKHTCVSERVFNHSKSVGADDFGALRKTCGVLLPDKYEFSYTIPDHRWICPVRSCRRVFAALPNLGSHFIVSFEPTSNQQADSR
jgi:hypothetical protein